MDPPLAHAHAPRAARPHSHPAEQYMAKLDPEGRLFIDRSGDLFSEVLEFLRWAWPQSWQLPGVPACPAAPGQPFLAALPRSLLGGMLSGRSCGALHPGRRLSRALPEPRSGSLCTAGTAQAAALGLGQQSGAAGGGGGAWEEGDARSARHPAGPVAPPVLMGTSRCRAAAPPRPAAPQVRRRLAAARRPVPQAEAGRRVPALRARRAAAAGRVRRPRGQPLPRAAGLPQAGGRARLAWRRLLEAAGCVCTGPQGAGPLAHADGRERPGVARWYQARWGGSGCCA
jgi:hypothetical protein